MSTAGTKRRRIFFAGAGDPVANYAHIVQLLRSAPSGMSLADLSSNVKVQNDDLRRYIVRLLSNGDVHVETDDKGLPRYIAEK
jgi:hypothetical protein